LEASATQAADRPAVTAGPDVPLGVFDEARHDLDREAVRARVCGDAPLAESDETSPVRADPETPLPVFEERSNRVAWDAVGLSERAVDTAGADSVQARASAQTDPDVSRARFQDRPRVVAGETLGSRVARSPAPRLRA